MKISLDSKDFKPLQDAVDKLSRHYIRVGVLSDAGSFVLMKAVVNQYGAKVWRKGGGYITIPARPFMTDGVDYALSQGLDEIIKKAVVAILKGADERAALRLVAEWLIGKIKGNFTRPGNGWIANAPATIRRKGSARPLIDTGELRGSIKYEIV